MPDQHDTPPQAAPVAESAATETPPSTEELLKQAELAAQEHREAWLRAKADADNIRKRAQTDIANAHKYAIENFSTELLAVKDSLEAALATENATVENLKSGVELTFTQPLDKASAEDVQNYSGERWNYLRTSNYGSPEFSVENPDKKGHDKLDITAAKLSADGKTVTQYKLPDPMVTNVCFGGKDLRTAYVTQSSTGKLLKGTWPAAGLKLSYQKV